MNLYAYAAGNPVNYVDPLGLWELSVEGYYGIGGGFSFGQNPDGSYYVSAKAGVGLGGGVSFDPDGKASGYDDCEKGMSFTSSGSNLGLGAGFGPFSGGYSFSSGERTNEWKRATTYNNSGLNSNYAFDGKWEFRLGGGYSVQGTISHSPHIVLATQ